MEHTNREYQEKGDYDFSTVKTVNWIKFVDEGDDYYRVDVNLGSALYRMVRNIIGSSLHVATGQMSIERLTYLLEEAPTRQENKATASCFRILSESCALGARLKTICMPTK